MAEILTFIRHTKTAAQPGICYGQADIDLAPTYMEEMNVVLKKIKLFQPQLMISSPLQRCTKLASFLEKQIQLPFQVDDRIKEISFGEWELKPWDQINQPKLLEWTESYENTPPPGGESFRMLQDRFTPFWDEIWQDEAKEAFIITHDGILRSALVKALKLTSRQVFSFNLSYGSIIRIKRVESDFYSIQIL
jgi:alpha-ribazole phosphatase